MAKRKKTPVRMQVTGRTIAYQQDIGKGGKLGKAKPVLITTTRVLGTVSVAKKTRKRRK